MTSRSGHPQNAAVGKPSSSGRVPSSKGRASTSASVGVSQPAPLTDAFDAVDGLVVWRGGFPEPDAADLEYEANLRVCRKERHDVYSFFVQGREVLVCSRCHGRWEEA